MTFYKIIIILITIFSSSVFASTTLPSAGQLSVTKISPEWVTVENYGTFSLAEDSLTRTFTVKSTTAFTSNQNPLLTGSSNFTVDTSGTCKSGFAFTTSNSCTIKIKFQVNNTNNSLLTTSLSFYDLNIPLQAQISLNVPVYKLTDYNGEESSIVDFNNLFSGENNNQTRTIYLKDINKSTLIVPSLNVSGSNFIIDQTCSISQINSNLGCPINFTFNSQNKSVQSYSTTASLAGISVNLFANVLNSNQKGITPFYLITRSTGQVLNTYNLGSFSTYDNYQSDVRVYVRDANRVVNNNISYSLGVSSSPYSLYYTSCSASNLKSTTGCMVRFIFDNRNISVDKYENYFMFNNVKSLSLLTYVNDLNPYRKNPNLVIFNATTGQIYPSLPTISAQPGSSSVLNNYYLKDLNQVSFPESASVSLSVLSSPFYLPYNSCSTNANLNSSGGCLFKISYSFSGQAVGSYQQSLLVNGIELAKVNQVVLGNICTPGTSQNCSITDGSGLKICNSLGNGFSTCQLTTCNSDYHTEDGQTCTGNKSSCSIQNGAGENWWLGNQWTSQCQIVSCQTDFHAENGQCLSNVQSCSINNGIGVKSWINGGYNDCLATSCNVGYHNENGICENDVQPYNGSFPLGVTAMVSKYNQNIQAYEAKVISCANGFSLIGNESCSVDGTINNTFMLTGDVSCGADNYFKVYYNSTTNLTTCASMDFGVVVLSKTGSTQNPPVCNSYEVAIDNPEINNDQIKIKCQSRVCQANYDRVIFNMYKNNSTGTISYSQSTLGTGFTLMGNTERVCTANGLGFGSQEIISCNDTNGYYWNKANKTCEPFDLVQGNPDTTSIIGAIIYKDSLTKKIYLEITDKTKHLNFIKIPSSSPYVSYNFSSDNNFTTIEGSTANVSDLNSVKGYMTQSLVAYSPAASTGSDASGSWVTVKTPANPYLNFESLNEENFSGFKQSFLFSSTPGMIFYTCNSNYRQYKTDYYAGTNLIKGLTECKSSNYQCNPLGEKKIIAIGANTIQLFSCQISGGVYKFLPDNNTTNCIGNTHLSGTECVSNIVNCSEPYPAGVFSYQSFWNGNEYSSCKVMSCNSNYHEITNPQTLEKTCENNFRILNIPGGTCAQTYSNNQWSSCSLTCNNNYHTGNNQCVANIISTPLSSGGGNNVCTYSPETMNTTCSIECNAGFYNNGSGGCTDEIIVTINPSNQLVFNKGNQMTLTAFSGGSSFTFRFSDSNTTTSSNGSQLSVINNKAIYTGGDFVALTGYSDTKTENIIITDNLNHSKTVSVTLHARGKECPFIAANHPLESDPLHYALKTYMVWNSSNSNYGSCQNALTCQPNTLLTNYQGIDQCINEKIRCTVYQDLNSVPEGVNNPVIDPLVKNEPFNGVKFWINNSIGYSSCQPYSCQSGNGVIFETTPGTWKCVTLPYVTSDTNIINNKGIYNNDLIQSGASYLSVIKTYASNYTEKPVWDKFVLNECPDNKRIKANGQKLECVSNFPDTKCYLGNERISSVDCQDSATNEQLVSDIRQSAIPSYPAFPKYGEYSFYQFNSQDFPNATCYDGNPGGFMYRKGYGSGKNRWVIVLQGGGACGTILSKKSGNPQEIDICPSAPASVTSFGVFNTGKTFTETNDFNAQTFGLDLGKLSDVSNNLDEELLFIERSRSSSAGKIGIISNQENINDEFKSWNHVLIRYCSQDLWTGKGKSVNVNNKHNGWYILDATLKTLKQDSGVTHQSLPKLPSLSNAQNVIVSGYSAGGEGIWYNGDFIKSVINDDPVLSNNDKTKRLAFLVDSGWLPSFSSDWGDSLPYNSFGEVLNYNLTNTWIGAYGTNQSIFGSETNQSQPTFVIQDAFDHEFLNYQAVLVKNGINNSSNISAKNEFNLYGGKFKEIYICDALNSVSKIYNEWELNSNMKLPYLQNYLFNDFFEDTNNGNSWKPKIFKNYQGLYFAKGRHGFTTSNDWSNLKINGLSVKDNFKKWYFNDNFTNDQFQLSYSNIDDLRNYLLSTPVCGSLDIPLNSYEQNNLYLDWTFLNDINN